MALWNEKELAQALAINLTKPVTVTDVAIDSRKVAPGAMFVALPGEKVDGHDYVESAFASGASAALVQRDKITDAMTKAADEKNGVLLAVPDVLQGLAALGSYRRANAKAKIFAVTGSVGKTSVKEMLAFLLGHIGATHATKGNYNNHIGLPLTLATMPKDADYAVIECGMNHSGELSELTKIARPDVAVVTTVAPVHLANFDNMEGVAQAKAEIYEGVPEGGICVAGESHPYADILRDKVKNLPGRRYVSALTPNADGFVRDYLPERGEAVVGASIFGKDYSFRLGSPGKHQAGNAVLALTALQAADVDPAQVIERFVDFFPVQGRGAPLTLKSGMFRGLTIIDDSYNAGPASVCAAIETVGERLQDGESFFIVLGDMLELGEGVEKYYRMIAAAAIKANVSGMYLVGKDCACIKDMLPDNVICAVFEDSVGLARDVANLLPKHCNYLLVKGSRGIKTERAIAALQATAS